MKHELPKLEYGYDALLPYMDARTVEIHYGKHHQTYVNNLNATLEKYPELAERSLEDLLRDIESVPEDIRTPLRNFGGGHWNHTFFWSVMASPVNGGGGEPQGALRDALIETFGDFQKFKDEFTKTAGSLFGSGWVWLVSENGKLRIVATANQDCPLSKGQKPILCIDVWEHSYYLAYQNRRLEYIEAWWNIVNWSAVEKYFLE